MSPAATKNYWRRWSKVVSARSWKPCKGILVLPAPTSDHETQVLAIAANLATAAHRAVTPDDLRHATHYIAAGRNCGHAALKPTEIDRLYSLWSLLVNPLNIEASISLDNPEISERRRIVHTIHKHVADTYVLDICADQFVGQFTPPHWEDLPITSLRQLSITLSQRTNRWTRTISASGTTAAVRPRKLPPLPTPKRAPTPEPEPALDCPF